MSRTTRRRLYGFNPGQRVYEEAKAENLPGVHPVGRGRYLGSDFRKNHWCHGRDAYKAKLTLRKPWGKGPDCLNSYEEVWGYSGKRWAKKQASRLRRLSAKDTIRGVLNEEGAE